jgi:uncharacterized protein with ATP-grasp and redox domains
MFLHNDNANLHKIIKSLQLVFYVAMNAGQHKVALSAIESIMKVEKIQSASKNVSIKNDSDKKDRQKSVKDMSLEELHALLEDLRGSSVVS